MEVTYNSLLDLDTDDFQELLDFTEETLAGVPYNDLAALTREIKLSFLDYVRQGIMLQTIRRYRLYKDKFKDFKTYCEQGLGRQHFYCKQIIKAAHICLRLIKSGFKILPNCIAQAIALKKYAAIDQYGARACFQTRRSPQPPLKRGEKEAQSQPLLPFLRGI